MANHPNAPSTIGSFGGVSTRGELSRRWQRLLVSLRQPSNRNRAKPLLSRERTRSH
jgi:hypothetical protein